MTQENRKNLARGVRNGIPISMGYFAVGFTIGIAAKNAGLTPWEGGLASMLNMASAGQFAGFTVIAAGSSFAALILMEIIINARYLLMSASLSQKIDENTGFIKRFLLSLCVTDEIFGISIAEQGKLDPFYTYGAYLISMPGWSIGTYLGTLMGGILPLRVMSALSVALFGMFLAVIIPPARKNRTVLALVLLSFAVSWAADHVAVFDRLPSGTMIILLTILLAGGAALLFPVSDEMLNQETAGSEVSDE